MAVVHLARHTGLGRDVALKELRVHRADDPQLVLRFAREAQMVASLSHPNVVTVHDFFEDDGLTYIVMELLRGGSLRARLEEPARKLSLPQLLGVLEGMLAGLGYAYEQGFVHRDIKPENVLVGSDGRVKIADFGIARALDSARGPALTRTGDRLGTPAYMAPEQVTTGEVGPWTDLYAVGLVAYEMATRRLPFDDSPTMVIAQRRLTSEPAPPVRGLAPDLDEGVADWIDGLLATDHEARPADASAAWGGLAPHARRLVGAKGLPSLLEAAPSARFAPPAPSPSPKPLAPRSQSTAGVVKTAPPATSRPRPSLVLGTVLCTALVALGGFATARAVGGDAREPDSAQTAVSSAAFALRTPDGWRRDASPARVPGVALEQPLAVAPPKPAGTRLVAGFTDADGPTLLALDEDEISRPAKAPERVTLGSLQALRYRDLAVVGDPATRLTLYAIPTDGKVVTVACMATAPAVARSLAACEHVATTLELRSARGLALGPSGEFARSASTILDRLEERRRREGLALRAARTQRGQASVAARAGVPYTLAARSFAALRAGPVERPAARRIVSELRAVRDAFAALASAARAGSATRYRSAARRVAQGVRSVDAAIARLRAAGYAVAER